MCSELTMHEDSNEWRTKCKPKNPMVNNWIIKPMNDELHEYYFFTSKFERSGTIIGYLCRVVKDTCVAVSCELKLKITTIISSNVQIHFYNSWDCHYHLPLILRFNSCTS